MFLRNHVRGPEHPWKRGPNLKTTKRRAKTTTNAHLQTRISSCNSLRTKHSQFRRRYAKLIRLGIPQSCRAPLGQEQVQEQKHKFSGITVTPRVSHTHISVFPNANYAGCGSTFAKTNTIPSQLTDLDSTLRSHIVFIFGTLYNDLGCGTGCPANSKRRTARRILTSPHGLRPMHKGPWLGRLNSVEYTICLLRPWQDQSPFIACMRTDTSLSKCMWRALKRVYCHHTSTSI